MKLSTPSCPAASPSPSRSASSSTGSSHHWPRLMKKGDQFPCGEECFAEIAAQFLHGSAHGLAERLYRERQSPDTTGEKENAKKDSCTGPRSDPQIKQLIRHGGLWLILALRLQPGEAPMPTYEYTCSACEGDFDIFHAMSDPGSAGLPGLRR